MAFLASLLKSLAELDQNAVVDYTSQARRPASTDAKSTVGAMLRAATLMGAQLQRQNVYIAQISRMQDIQELPDGSPNPDLDSFFEQFGFERNLAGFATGAVTFNTASPVPSNLLVPYGVIVQTATGVQYIVVTDSTNPADNPSAGGYYITTGNTSVAATVKCLTGGTIGNAQAGQINQLYAGPGAVQAAGISTVANTDDFNTGTSIESDSDAKARFTTWFQTGRTGTISALYAAAMAVQTGLTVSIADLTNPSGSYQNNFFTAVVGTPGQTAPTPSSLLALVQAAFEGSPPLGPQPVRAEGVEYAVISPTLETVAIVATIYAQAGVNKTALQAACSAAVTVFLNAQKLDPLGAPVTLSYIDVGSTLRAVPGVKRVDGLQLNGGTADVVAPFATLITAGSVALTLP